MSDRYAALAARLLRTDLQRGPPDPAARTRGIATIERALREPRRLGSAIDEVACASGAARGMPQDKSLVQGREQQLTLAWTDTYDGVHPEAATPHERAQDQDDDVDDKH
jgi:hypothetical protein